MTRTLFLILALIPCMLFAGSPGKDAALSASESAEIVGMLEDTRGQILSRVAGLSDAQWKFKTAPDRWSAAEIVEHLYLTEGAFAKTVTDLLAGKPNPEWAKLTAGADEKVTKMVPDRSNPVKAPPFAVPQGKLSRNEVVGNYLEGRAKMIGFAQDRTKPYKSFVQESPLGPLHAAQWIRFTAMHNVRHLKQLDEVLADPGFPK